MRKGQFTLVVVVAVIAAAAILSFVLMQDPSVDEPRTKQGQQVKKYIESCLSNVAKQGLRKLGRQGGYLKDAVQPETIPATDRSYIAIPPGSDRHVRYWRHVKGECPSCTESINIPSLTGDDSITSSYEAFIEDNISDCVRDKQIEPRYNITDTPEAAVTFGEEDVTINLTYPVTVAGPEPTRLSDYQTRLDVPFRDLYRAATGVVIQVMARDHFAETVSQQVLTALSTGERAMIPPMQGGISFSRVQPWMMSDVRSLIQTHLSQEVSKVMLQGSRDPLPLPEDPEDRQNMNLLLASTGPSFDGVGLNRFSFSASYVPWYDINLDIEGNGASSHMVVPKPIDMPNMLGLLPDITRLNYVYDLSYPVILRFQYPEAFAGKGYEFTFGYESHLENNYAFNGSVETLESSPTNTGTYLCDPPQWNTGRYNFSVTNASNNAPLANAKVEMSCGGESCTVGETNSSGKLQTRLPVCAFGNITVTKRGYDSITLGGTFGVDSEDSYSVELQSQQNIRVRPWIKPLAKVLNPTRNKVKTPPEWRVTSGTLDVREHQEAIIMFSHADKEEYVRVATYNGSDTYPQVSLLPGEYKVEGYVVENLNKSGNKFTIEEATIEGASFLGIDVSEDQRLQPIYFNSSMLVGSVKYPGPVNVSVSDLKKKYMNVRMAGIDTENNPINYHVDLNVLSKFNNITLDEYDKFRPTFSDS